MPDWLDNAVNTIKNAFGVSDDSAEAAEAKTDDARGDSYTVENPIRLDGEGADHSEVQVRVHTAGGVNQEDAAYDLIFALDANGVRVENSYPDGSDVVIRLDEKHSDLGVNSPSPEAIAEAARAVLDSQGYAEVREEFNPDISSVRAPTISSDEAERGIGL
jgi:hypothetical protein